MKKRDETLASLQASKRDVEQRYEECLERARVAESGQQALEREQELVRRELEGQEQLVRELEQCVEQEKTKREQLVEGLKEELGQEQTLRDQDAVKYSQLIQDLEESIKTKVGKGSSIGKGSTVANVVILDTAS